MTAAAGKGTRPRTAMLLAAGRGTRLAPATDSIPKPLVEVVGRTLIDRALDRLHEAGVAKAVVNLHHLGDAVERHLARRRAPDIAFSREDALLETGGGILKALPLLGPAPFYAANADVIWLNGPTDALHRLADRWDDSDMDALLLLHATVDAYGYRGVGDFTADSWGKLRRRAECEVVPYLFTGVQILHPRLFADAPAGAFSLNILYDHALARQRLYGVVHDGEWFHVGDADGLAQAESFLRVRYAGKMRR
jgi:MurNAc alpha-1-phosphate uridylyltransferase